MKQLIGIICAGILMGSFLVLIAPAQAETPAQLQAQKQYAKQRYTLWMERHRSLRMKWDFARRMRQNSPKGTSTWHRYNNDANRLVTKMNKCREAADYWAGKIEQIESGTGLSSVPGTGSTTGLSSVPGTGSTTGSTTGSSSGVGGHGHINIFNQHE
jgi:hypothetical protein